MAADQREGQVVGIGAVIGRLGGEMTFAILHLVGVALGITAVKLRTRMPKVMTGIPPVAYILVPTLLMDAIAYAAVVLAGADKSFMTTAMMAGALVGAVALILIQRMTSKETPFWGEESADQAASMSVVTSHALILTGFVATVWLAFKL